MNNYLLAIGLLLILLLGWIVVQQTYKLFARRHPELGPFRKEGGACGSCCSDGACGGGACETDEK